MTTATLNAKGQIVIPAKIRDQYGLKAGSKVIFEERESEFILKPVNPKFFDQIAGTLETKGKLSKALLAQRRSDKKKGK